MPATGNSVPLSSHTWSIRLWRGGLSFFTAGDGNVPLSGTVFFGELGFTPAGVSAALDKLPLGAVPAQGVSVRLYIDIPLAVFIPEEVVAVSDPYALLSAVGIDCASSEAVVTEAWESVCAGAALPQGVMGLLRSRFGATMHLSSPLHEIMAAYRKSGIKGSCFIVYPTQESVYITQYGIGGELLMAEVYPCRNAADMIYYLNELAAEQGLKCKDVQVYIHGDRPERYTSTLKKYFVRTRTL